MTTAALALATASYREGATVRRAVGLVAGTVSGLGPAAGSDVLRDRWGAAARRAMRLIVGPPSGPQWRPIAPGRRRPAGAPRSAGPARRARGRGPRPPGVPRTARGDRGPGRRRPRRRRPRGTG